MALQAIDRVVDNLSDVSAFGGRVVQVLQDYVSLRLGSDSRIQYAVQIINVSLRSLGQLTQVLEKDRVQISASQKQSVFNDEALQYIESLAEEFALAYNQIRVIITEERPSEEVPKFWKSLKTTGNDGIIKNSMPDFDAADFFRKCNSVRWSRILRAVELAANRVDSLQVHLLLVIQVANVRDLAEQVPSGNINLQNIIECHGLVQNAAHMAHIANSRGDICEFKKPKSMPLKRYYSSSSSSSSDDMDSGSDSDSDSVVEIRDVPRRRRSKVGPANDITIENRGPPPPPPKFHEESGRLPDPGKPVVEEIVEVTRDIHHPPMYTEKDAPVMNKSVSPTLQTVDTKVQIDAKEAHIMNEKFPKSEEESETSTLPIKPASTLPQEAQLLKRPSGFGTKIRSLFRSKSSLEAEMKEMLASDDASLSAFVINNALFRKVPHTAFHSLEWTHMRTILSQLHDNSWFKTYADLTDDEHDTLKQIIAKRKDGSRCVESELVVLKVLQKNRFNSLIRLFEDCIRLEREFFQPRNYRIILVVVREKEVSDGIKIGPTKNTRVGNDLNTPHAIRPPNPLPFAGIQHSRVIDLNMPPIRSLPPGVGYVPDRGQVCNGGSPFPAPPGRRPFPGLLNPRESISYSDLNPIHNIYEEDARAALTDYIAFTFRRAPPTTHPFPSTPNNLSTWARCLVTRERESNSTLLQRVKEFNSRGISIIDMKLELTDFQASQITHIVDELTNFEANNNFVYQLVELSMLDRELGFIRKQSIGTFVDVIHIIVQRKPADGMKCQDLYEQLTHPRLRLPPPIPRPGIGPRAGPPPPPPPVHIINSTPKPKRPAKKYYRRESVDSDSSLTSFSSGSSVPYRRRNRGRNNKRDERRSGMKVARWEGRDDPVLIIFDKSLMGKDVVQCLLDRWVQRAEKPENKASGKGKEKENLVEM